jgi:hypothetical protein
VSTREYPNLLTTAKEMNEMWDLLVSYGPDTLDIGYGTERSESSEANK